MNLNIKPGDALMLAALIVMVLILVFAGHAGSQLDAQNQQSIEQLESR